jgi:hypothetical protein
MAEDKLLKTLIKNLEVDFRGFRKELSKYQFVIDMTRVDAFTKAKVGSTLKSKYPKLKNYETWGTDTVGKKTTNFIVLTSRNQLETVNDVLKTAAEKDDQTFQDMDQSGFNTQFTQNQFQSPASVKRQEKFILERSSEAQARLASMVTAKTKEYLTLASPEFTAEFIDKVGQRLNKYTFDFNISDNVPTSLKDRLFSSVIETFSRELKQLKPKTALDNAINERVHNLGVAFETGKSTKDVKTRTRKTVKSNKRIKTTKTYYQPLQSTSGIFLSASSLHNTLNILLHDIIETQFMKSSSAASNKNYLRYQTGRFARSARVDQVDYTGSGVINISYDYMTNPYETFTDGTAHGPGRNPENIISAAIRSILIRHVGEKFQSVIRKT